MLPLLGFAAALMLAPQDSVLPVIPRPVSAARTGGADFRLTARTAIVAPRAAAALAIRLRDDLAPATGWQLPLRGAAGEGPAIVLRLERGPDSLGDEGYRLDVTSRRVTIRARTPAGLFYGIQTLRQLLPPDILRAAPVAGAEWTVPAVRITDHPRFSWRGAHLDAGRHFMPVSFVKRFLDLMAFHKLNRFHWHLTDDQGWRLQVPRYPRLTDVGSCRTGTIIGHPNDDSTKDRYDTIPHCGFYTQDDVREVVAYAAARFITVVPEIEMPGHSQAAVSAYPQLGVTGRPIEVWRSWGVSPWILNPTDSTIAFYQNVLTEVMGLFPGPWIHVGGDEATKVQWDSSAQVQAQRQALGLQTMDQLQAWFIGRMDSFLTAHGRRLIGWDEILEGGLSPNATVMSWRGTAGGIAAARAGHDVVMTPTSNTYLDYYQTRDVATETLRIGGYLPIETVYGFEPVPDSLTPDQAAHILGTQGQLWSEYLASPRDVEWQAFPRLSALAEVAWSPKAARNFADFQQRLGAFKRRLDILDVNYYRVRTVTAAQ